MRKVLERSSSLHLTSTMLPLALKVKATFLDLGASCASANRFLRVDDLSANATAGSLRAGILDR